MAKELASVRLLGTNTTNPGIPRSDVQGKLFADSSSLQFIGNGGSIRYEIPWESIDLCEVETQSVLGAGCIKIYFGFLCFGGLIGGLGMSMTKYNLSATLTGIALLLLSAIGLIYIFFILSNSKTLIVIKHWNEAYGYDATVRLLVGAYTFSYGRAHDIVREIWGYRGDVRTQTHRATRVHLG